MKRVAKLAIWFLGLYLVVLGTYFLFAAGSMRYDSLARLEQRINPSTFVFWQNGQFFRNPPIFSQLMTDTYKQLSPHEPTKYSDIDIWVLLLEGFDDIRNVEVASKLGIDSEDIAASEPGSKISLMGASLKLRLHPVPFIVERRHIVMLDAEYLTENYRQQCLDEMVYHWMIGLRDRELWDQCKKD